MRKFKLESLFILQMLFIFGICLIQFNQISSATMNQASYGQDVWEFYIPAQLAKEDPTILLEQFDHIMKQYHANLIVQSIDTNGKKPEYRKSIVIYNSQYYEKRNLPKHAYLNHDKAEVLSTINKPESKYKLAIFNQKMDVTFQSFPYSIQYDNYVFSGYARIETVHVEKQQLEQDLRKIHSEITLYSYGASMMNIPYTLLIYLVWIISGFYITNHVVRNVRNIAIYQIHGYSLWGIWQKAGLPILARQVVITIAGIVILPIVSQKMLFTDFLASFAAYGFAGVMITIMLIMMVIMKTYISMDIVSLLKRKASIFAVGIAERVSKLFILLGVVVVSLVGIEQFTSIYQFYSATYKDWSNTEDLYIVSAIKNIDYKTLTSKEFQQAQVEVLKKLMQEGSILADFHLSTGDSRVDGVIDWNYMKRHQIRGIDGKLLPISDDHENRILLIPHHLKEQTEQIVMNYRQGIGMSTEEITVYYMDAGQRFFTYAFPGDYEIAAYLVDPVLSMHTAGNQHLFNSDIVAGVMYDPFKIKISDQFTMEQYRSLLAKHGLLAYYSEPLALYPQISAKIQETKDSLSYLSIAFGFICFIAGNYLYRNILSFLMNHQQKIAIQTMHGYRFIAKYRQVLFESAVMWCIVMLLYWLIQPWLLTFVVISEYAVRYAALVIAGYIILEFMIQIWLIYVLEQRKVIPILKGDRE